MLSVLLLCQETFLVNLLGILSYPPITSLSFLPFLTSFNTRFISNPLCPFRSHTLVFCYSTDLKENVSYQEIFHFTFCVTAPRVCTLNHIVSSFPENCSYHYFLYFTENTLYFLQAFFDFS